MSTTAETSPGAALKARADRAAEDRSIPVAEVIRLYQEVLTLDPSQVDAWAELGVCFALSGQPEEALRAFERGLAIDPRHARCLAYRGDTLKRAGNAPGALEAYRALVSAYPDDPAGWVKLGHAQSGVGLHEDGLASMERSLAQNPRLLQAQTGKAELEVKLGRMPSSGGLPLPIGAGQLMRDLAEAQVEAVVRDLAPARQLAVAPASLQTGPTATALAALEEAVRLAPRNVKAIEDLARALLDLGRVDDAASWFERWIAVPMQRDRDLARAWWGKGVCLRRQGKYLKAISALDHALSLHGGHLEMSKERAATVADLRRATSGSQPAQPGPPSPPSEAPGGQAFAAGAAQLFTMTVGPEVMDPVAEIRQRMEEVASLSPKTAQRPRAAFGGSGPPRFRQLLTEASALNEHRQYGEALRKIAEAERLDAQFAELHAAKGMSWRGLGKWSESVAAFQRAVDLDGSVAQPWFFLADGLDNLGELDHALACYEQTVRLDPKHVDAWVDRGHVLSRLGRVLDAVDSWSRALALDPRSLHAWLNKGYAEAALGRHADAIASLTQFLELNPPAQLSEQVARTRRLLAECRAKLSNSEADPPGGALQALFNEARQADRDGRKEVAIEGYRALLERDPASFPAWMNLGTCYEELGRPREALPCYERALAINGAEALAWAQKGVCLERLGRREEGLVAVEQCTRLGPQHAVGWLNLGRMLLQERRPADALAALERALGVNPREASGWRLKARALEQLGRLSETLGALQRYAELVPGDVAANNHRLALKKRLG